MGWFCLLWTFFIAQVSCQELNINSCTRDEVNFICVIRGSPNLTSLILAWSSPEYIGQGDALRFTTATMPGMNSTSVINENVTATLTSNTEIDGVPKLVSMLRIISASQSSLITCSSVTNRSSANIMFDSSAFRGRPQNVGAREYSAGSCDILVSWEPPANIDRSDISHYIIYVPSQNMMNISSSTTKFLTIPNCRDGNNSIQVAAVNRLGCVGRNSSLIKLNLVETPTTQATRPHSATAVTALVVGVLSLLMVMVLVVVVAILIHLICVLYRKAKNRKFTRDKDKVTKAELDDFKTGRGIPNCVLEEQPLVEPIPRLLHEITLNGVKPPYIELTLKLRLHVPNQFKLNRIKSCLHVHT